jgi:hypothetical protein
MLGRLRSLLSGTGLADAVPRPPDPVCILREFGGALTVTNTSGATTTVQYKMRGGGGGGATVSLKNWTAAHGNRYDYYTWPLLDPGQQYLNPTYPWYTDGQNAGYAGNSPVFPLLWPNGATLTMYVGGGGGAGGTESRRAWSASGGGGAGYYGGGGGAGLYYDTGGGGGGGSSAILIGGALKAAAAGGQGAMPYGSGGGYGGYTSPADANISIYVGECSYSNRSGFLFGGNAGYKRPCTNLTEGGTAGSGGRSLPISTTQLGGSGGSGSAGANGTVVQYFTPPTGQSYSSTGGGGGALGGGGGGAGWHADWYPDCGGCAMNPGAYFNSGRTGSSGRGGLGVGDYRASTSSPDLTRRDPRELDVNSGSGGKLVIDPYCYHMPSPTLNIFGATSTMFDGCPDNLVGLWNGTGNVGEWYWIGNSGGNAGQAIAIYPQIGGTCPMGGVPYP